MALTLQQHAELQPRILDMQRLALSFAEIGESKISSLLMQATVRAQRIKPTKETTEPATPAKARKSP